MIPVRGGAGRGCNVVTERPRGACVRGTAGAGCATAALSGGTGAIESRLRSISAAALTSSFAMLGKDQRAAP
jgi:hypothetical protein